MGPESKSISLDINEASHQEKKNFLIEHYWDWWVGFSEGKFVVAAPKKMRKEFFEQMDRYGKGEVFVTRVGYEASEELTEELFLFLSVFL